jgi:hypothetical protein
MPNTNLAVTEPTNPTLASTVSKTLRQHGLSKVNFKFCGLTVTGSHFIRVADAVDAGRIKCWTASVFKSQGKDELAKGMIVNARYDLEPNAMVFSDETFGSGPGEDRSIVHEAVHAAFDLDAPTGKKTSTLSIDDESAAVLAVAFYIRLCDRPIGGFLMDADGPEKPALALVDSLADRTGDVPTWTGPYTFEPLDVQAIRNGTAMKWNFRSFIDTDGRPTDRSGAKYVYDGVPVCANNACK